jgi:hypothetical protein
MNAAQAPIFVLAAPFCHASRVCAMLGQHPALFGLPSLHLFSQPTLGALLRWFAAHPKLSDGLLRTIAHLFCGGQSPEAIASAQAWLDAREHFRPAEMLTSICAAVPGRRIVEWSFSTAQPRALARLAEECPHACFIHALCDPSGHRAAVIADRQHRELDSPFDPERFWLEPNLAIYEFVQSLPWQRHIRLPVEMLATTPEATLRQLLEWLCLPCDPASLGAMLEPERSPFARLTPAGAESRGDMHMEGVLPRTAFLQKGRRCEEDNTGVARKRLSESTKLFASRWNCFSSPPSLT